MRCYDCVKYEKTYRNFNEIIQCKDGHNKFFESDNCPYYSEKHIIKGYWGTDEGHICQLQCGKCGEYQQMWLGEGFIEGLIFKCSTCGKLNEINAH